MKTMDGNTAAAHVSYAFTDVAAIYPITPSSPMADYTDNGLHKEEKYFWYIKLKLLKCNLKQVLQVPFMVPYSRCFNYNIIQLLKVYYLMIPNMYKIAGELLPCVFDVSARALASHAYTSSVIIMMFTLLVKQVSQCYARDKRTRSYGLSAVAHLATIEGRVPFMQLLRWFPYFSRNSKN